MANSNFDGSDVNSTTSAFVDDRNVIGVVLYATGLSIGMTFSVQRNTLTLAAIALHRTLQTNTYYFIASLAMADMLNGGTTFASYVS